MKQLISVLIFSCLCSFSYAEEMKFVTVLSSPNGTFNRLETTDPNTAVSGLTVNFCTKIGRSGTVLLKGKKHVSLNQLTLNTATTLGRTDAGKFSLANVVINRSGSLTGGQLFGDDLAVKSSSTGSAVNVYSEDLVLSGAKTVGLTVGSASESQYSVMSGTGSTDKGMVWSNEYQQDEACKSGSSYEDCKKQYLLKEKSVPVTSEKPECTQKPHPSTSCEVYYGREGLGSQQDWIGSVQYEWDEDTCEWKRVSDTCQIGGCSWETSPSGNSYTFYTSQKVYCTQPDPAVYASDIEPSHDITNLLGIPKEHIHYIRGGICNTQPTTTKDICVDLTVYTKGGMISCPHFGASTPPSTSISNMYTLFFTKVYKSRCETSRL